MKPGRCIDPFSLPEKTTEVINLDDAENADWLSQIRTKNKLRHIEEEHKADISKIEQRIEKISKEYNLNPKTIREELDDGRQETWAICKLLMDMSLLERLKNKGVE